MANTQIEKQVYNLVSCLADNFGFDADAAFEYARWETDVDYVGEILKITSTTTQKAPSTTNVENASSDDKTMDAINTCKKNIALWEKKLADGKVKDADKQQEKIDKEKAKLAKLEAKSPAPEKKEEPKKKEKKVEVSETKKEEPKKKEEKEKRIKRMSPVMTDQLKKALAEVKLDFSDKLKKEFVQYVDDLTDDDFKKVGLADHMRDFSKLKAPPKEDVEEEPEEEEEAVMPEPQTNVSGGGPPEHADKSPIRLTIGELQKIEMTASVEPTGTYWDADNGRFVKGPDADEDEDMEEVKFDGKDYVVGEKTGRVYEARENGDFFAGFIGVGKFKTMKKPE